MSTPADSIIPSSSDDNEGAAPVRDRLTTTLFLAALFHGIVVLGVAFAAPRAPPGPPPTLAVLLLTGADTQAADNASAQYLAQRNQVGTGTTDDAVRPANPASSTLPLQQGGIAEGTGSEYREATAGHRSSEFVTSRSDRGEISYRSGAATPAWAAETPLALAPTTPSPIATNATDMTLRLRGRQDGKYEVIPNTRRSIIAPYLDAWRNKIERLGTEDFPVIAQKAAHAGNPVLEVAIRADGTISDVVIRRSSGSKELDHAAVQILNRASPFNPFPTDLRQKYDELRFAYEWQFLGGPGKVSASGNYATR